MDIALVAIVGLVIGSFLNVCIYRIPRGESIASPPSHCGSCGTHLKPLDLVPVLSYLFLGGRCRYCHSRISVRYPLVELLTAGLLTGLYLHTGFGWLFGFYGTLFIVLIAVGFIDLDRQIIPDSLVIAGALAGIGMNIAGAGIGFVEGLLGALAGGGTLLLIALIALYAFKKEGMGGGDIKLMAMAGAFPGMEDDRRIPVSIGMHRGGSRRVLVGDREKEKAGRHTIGPLFIPGHRACGLLGREAACLVFDTISVERR